MDEDQQIKLFTKLLAACWTRKSSEIAHVLIEFERPDPSIGVSVLSIAHVAIQFYKRHYHEITYTPIIAAINEAVQARYNRLGPELWFSNY